jgi:hypothetical protein
VARQRSLELLNIASTPILSIRCACPPAFLGKGRQGRQPAAAGSDCPTAIWQRLPRYCFIQHIFIQPA